MAMPKLSVTRRAVIISVAVFILFSITAAFWLIANTKAIPDKYRQGLTYPTYYPYNLPAGYSVNQSSYTRKGSVLIYTIQAPNGKTIAVSEERVPPGLDLTQHQASDNGIKLPDEDDFTTGIGQAQISFWGSNLVCSLVTPGTWIILNVSGFTNKQSELVAQAFRPL